MASTVLTPAITAEIERLGRVDLVVGIPSFKNATTIGHVDARRAGRARPVLRRPAAAPRQLRRRLARRDPARGRRDRAARLRRADPARPAHEPPRAPDPHLPRGGRRRRQGRGPAHDLRDRGRARRAGPGRGRLRPPLDHPGVDRAARRAHPQGRLRLRDAALRPPQVRRHDHEHGHLPADAGPLRAADPAADRRRLRRLRRPRPPLPRPGGLDARGQQVRDRHLDDDARPRRRVRRLRDPPRAPRSTTRRTPRRTSGRCSARWSGRSSAWPAATPTRGSRSTAATRSRPTASSAGSSRARSR